MWLKQINGLKDREQGRFGHGADIQRAAISGWFVVGWNASHVAFPTVHSMEKWAIGSEMRRGV